MIWQLRHHITDIAQVISYAKYTTKYSVVLPGIWPQMDGLADRYRGRRACYQDRIASLARDN
ncbi:predicted protein [Sclerotinia sclerotiorum 1980 UF-70]|uniref:Uncharacterized protein n=1 Tax=Sclerotinia sclerotiorum (strain ATCC 18683 / 1980 / Ss-1) TaxID=665079 RepID=A7EY02_SCLS1|nr:predicted protein [Sclerotinia sclerotiorum 1980 UF-70]EDN94344.1 predicted protein [Sclerotinia sclerotiorum 1980 UF-70]